MVNTEGELFLACFMSLTCKLSSRQGTMSCKTLSLISVSFENAVHHRRPFDPSTVRSRTWNRTCPWNEIEDDRACTDLALLEEGFRP